MKVYICVCRKPRQPKQVCTPIQTEGLVTLALEVAFFFFLFFLATSDFYMQYWCDSKALLDKNTIVGRGSLNPLFYEDLPILPTPPLLWENPTPPFWENFHTSTSPLHKGREWFQQWKLYSIWQVSNRLKFQKIPETL